MTPVAERIAMNICWIARQPGLPESAVIRAAIAERHPLTCDWCDFPLDELLAMGRVDREEPEARAFRKYPNHQQREAVMKAQGAVKP